MRQQVYGLTTALILISTAAMAADVGKRIPEKRAAFGAVVRSYLLENPRGDRGGTSGARGAQS